MKRKKTVKKLKTEPKVHEELKGFDIKINKFGELETNIQIDKLNDFLNENIEDKRVTNTDSEEE